MITEIDNEATVSKDVVRVKAVVKIELLTEGWHEVPLRLADSAITEASIGGQPARIVSAGPAGYKLLLEKKGKKPEQIELTLNYAKGISKAPGLNSVSFEAPQVPVSRWRIRIPEPGVKVNVQPQIAATETSIGPAAKRQTGEEKKPAPEEQKAAAAEKKPAPAPAPAQEETLVNAYVGAAPTVRIEWTPKAEGATGLEALASVQAEQRVTIAEGAMRTRCQLDFAISRADLRQVALEIPADQKSAQRLRPQRAAMVRRAGRAGAEAHRAVVRAGQAAPARRRRAGAVLRPEAAGPAGDPGRQGPRRREGIGAWAAARAWSWCRWPKGSAAR